MTLPPFPFLPASPEERLRLTQYGELCARMAVEAHMSDIMRCRYPVCTSINPSGYGWDIPRLNEVIADAAIDAARSGGKGDGE